MAAESQVEQSLAVLLEKESVAVVFEAVELEVAVFEVAVLVTGVPKEL